MFQHSHLRGSGQGSARDLFFLPPALLKCLESRPIEEVLFLRDEMANLAWAIERVVESPAERPLSRFEGELEQKRRTEQECSPGGDFRGIALSAVNRNSGLLGAFAAGAN